MKMSIEENLEARKALSAAIHLKNYCDEHEVCRDCPFHDSFNGCALKDGPADFDLNIPDKWIKEAEIYDVHADSDNPER